jgi:protein SCO1
MRRAAIPIAAALFLATACGGRSGEHATTTGSARAVAERSLRAPMVVDPPRRAAPIRLRDQFGRPTTLAEFRGRVVAVTFVYAHCPDVCPLILQALGAARARLGNDAGRFQIVAVSVDPRGDTAPVVRRFLAARGLLHRARYLRGTRTELRRVWRAYGVASRPEQRTPELIEHSALIYLIDGGGRIRALYPATPLDARAIAHDVELLAHRAADAA